MGKKKKSQNSNTPITLGDSSESESSKDSNQATEGSKIVCPHLAKSVELTQLRKNIKTNKDKSNDLLCFTCKRSSKNVPCQEAWICLRCGSCNCGPSDEDHREDHYKAPRSDTHYVAFQVNSNVIWCFKCQQEIPIDVNKKVQSCVEFIKKNCSDQLPFTPVKVEQDSVIANGLSANDYLKPESLLTPFQGLSLNNNEIKPVLNLPKVRGLSNLGNTCFFNSVLQCLAQTPGLVDLLREMEVPGEKFHLELDGVTIDATLAKIPKKNKQNTLSEQLAQILTEVSGVKTSGTGDEKTGWFAVNPRLLLSALTAKCPQFEGGDQHDAQELLRHLLDSVHAEDLRRYQKAILDHIGYEGKLDELDDDRKQFGKKLNQKVCDTIPIRPDQIFKGSLVSILQCTVCNHISKREEPFLDLSLPVTQEKDKPPSLGKKKPNCNSPVEEEDKSTDTASTKFPKNKSRRNHKQQRTTGYSYGPVNEHGQDDQTAIEEEDKKDSLDADQSDADIEDNEDNVCDERENKAEVVESGYSSEKQMSARGSPVTTQSPEEKTKCNFKTVTEEASAVFQSCEPKVEITAETIGDVSKSDVSSCKNDAGMASRPVQELSLTIPEETNTECTSQDSVRVNASNNSPNVSSDSQQGSYNKNADLAEGDYKLPDNSDNRADRTAMVYEWNCTGNVSQGQESLSVSPQCGSGSSQDINISPKESVLSGSQSNENMSLCTSIPLSNDNMSVCNSLPENVSIILNSPTKSQKEESESDEHLGATMSSETSRILKSRSSPVDMEATTRLDSGLLKLSLEGIPSVHNINELHRNSAKNWSDKAEAVESPKNSEEAEPRMASKSPIPLPPPMPLFSAPCSLDHRNSAKNWSDKAEAVESPKNSEEAEPRMASKSPIPLPPPMPLFSAPCSLDLTKKPQPSVQTYSHTGIPHHKYKFEEGECSLQSCLNQFTLIEVLFGANKVGCEACTEKCNKGKEGKTVYQNSTKQLLISKLPSVVIFHLKRFQVQRFSFRKISKHVEFPLILDISQFCTDENKKGPILYSLYGVVEHSGTLHGGHYVAYVKVRCHAETKTGQAPPGKWYYVSDSRVSDIDESSVLKTQAYLLFYERIL